MNEVKKLVVKVGSGYLYHLSGGQYYLKEDNIGGLVEEACILRHKYGIKSAIFSSGAAATGYKEFELTVDVAEALSDGKKAFYATCGQKHLTDEYEIRFKGHGLRCTQYLVTDYDFCDEAAISHIINSLDMCHATDSMPVFNGNDGVKSGLDNDKLATELAKLWGADALVMFSKKQKGLGTGGGSSKEKVKKELDEKGIELKIINDEYLKSDGRHDSKYRPNIRAALNLY